MYCIIGEGANDLEIPLLFFSEKEKALEFLSDNFEQYAGNERWKADECDDWDGGDGEVKLLFKNGRYYNGCGGCYSLILKEVEEGKPIVSWDLD